MQPTQPQRPAWKPWHKITLTVIGGIAALLLLIVIIAAITTSEDDPDNPADAAQQDTEIPDGFDDYLADLDAIDPGITQDREDRHVYLDADNTCADINDGLDDDTLIDRTIQRYGVNEAADLVTDDIAAQILDATRDHCDTIRPE